MISDAKYLTNNNFYTDDKIIVLAIERKFQTKQILTISTDKYFTVPKLEHYLITKDIIVDTVMLQDENIYEYILSICKDDSLYTIIINTELLKQLNIENIKRDHKNINIIDIQYADNNIDEIANFSIEITDSNIKNIIHLTHQVLNEIAIFSTGSIDFNNYITYKYIGYDVYKTIQLQYYEKIPFHYQIYALINFIYYGKMKLELYTKYLYKSFKYICKYDQFNECISILDSHINDIRNMEIENELNPDIPTDMLFKQYIYHSSTQKMLIKNNTYIKNIKKIKDRDISFPIDIIENDLSLDMYVSTITLDNWQDTVGDHNCFGILVNVKCSKVAKLGLCCKNIIVTNYTNTFITKNEVIIGQEHYLKKFKTFDNGMYAQNMLMGSGIGKGNGILPIYINNIHWNIAKLYIEECISLTVSQNSFSFNKNMLNVYSITLLKVIDNICSLQSSYKDFHTFINLYITLDELNIIYDMNTCNHKLFSNNNENINRLTCILDITLLNMLMYGDISIDTVFFANMYEEIVRRELYTHRRNMLKLFTNYIKNKDQIISFIDQIINLNNLNNIYKLCKTKKILTDIIIEFKSCNGVVSETSYLKFKQLLYKNSYIYNTDIRDLNNVVFTNDIIIDNLLLQSYITKNNIKRMQSYSMSYYRNIITSSIEDINDIKKNIINKLR